MPAFDVENGAVPNRPNVLDSIDASLGGLDHVPAVNRHSHAQPMRFVAGGPNQVGRQEFIELDEIESKLLFSLHRLAGLAHGGDRDVPSDSPRTRCIGRRPAPADRTSGRPNSRTPNLAEIGPAFLRQGPWTILEDFDRGAGRYSEIEIRLPVEIFQVAVTVDEAREDGLARHVDHRSATGDGTFAAAPHGLKPICLNYNGRIIDGLSAGPVN